MNFDSYRKYLEAYLKLLPHKGYGEASRIAKYLGVSSTYVSHIFSGKKVLSLEQAESLTTYIGLSDIERDYFFELVQLERAGTHQLKEYIKHRLSLIKKNALKLSNRLENQKNLSDEKRAVFYSSAVYSAVHIYCSTGEKTSDEIAKRFRLNRKKAASILSFLVESGLVAEKNGRYSVGSMKTHLESSSPFLMKHHANWRTRAIVTSEDLTEEELMYTANVSLSEKDFHLLREKMVEFIKSFLKSVHASGSEEIACFSLDFFKIRW